MIQRLLQFQVRKDIKRKNKPINHVALVKSMDLFTKVPFLAKYHKKKLIAFALALIIIHTYDLQKPIYRKVVSMRSPLHLVQSLFVEQKKIPNTILEQNYAGIALSQSTVKLLNNLYVSADNYLYFGVGRSYLFQVYKQLGVIQTEEQKRKFWVSSGFYKERNQKAAGIGFAENLTIFQQAYSHVKKKNSQITEEQFLSQFALKFIEKFPSIATWEKQFNQQRTSQFMKNMPGDNEKKKDAIIQIIREASKSSKTLITQQEMESKIKQMGLKGLNLTDKILFWELKRTWQVIQVSCLEKKISHPLSSELEKSTYSKQKQIRQESISNIEQKLKQFQGQYEILYKQKIF